MAPPLLFTADRAGRTPAPPDPAGVSTEWLAETFGGSLFVTQEERMFLFARARTCANGAPVVVLTGATDSTAEASEVEVPLAALRDTGTHPHIAKIYLSLFHTPISLADEEVTAQRARAGDATVKKVVVTRLKSDGVTVTRGQSTLNVQTFLSLVASKLASIELVLPTGRGGGEPQPRPQRAADGLPCASLRKLTAMGGIVGVFSTGEPSLTWGEAEAFLSAALGQPVASRTAAVSAATKLDSKLTVNSKTKAALQRALGIAQAAGLTLSMADRGEMLAAHGLPSATPSPAARAQQAAKRKDRAPPPPAEPVDVESDGDDEEEGEDSNNSDSYGSDGDDAADEPAPPATAPQAPRPAAPAQPTAAPGAQAAGASARPHKKKKSTHAGAAGDKSSPVTDLARLTPAGWKASQVARVLFDDPLLSETAKYSERPQADSDSDAEDVAQRRVAFAVRRLKDISGDGWIPKERVADKKALKHVREQVFHLVARGPVNQSTARAGASSATLALARPAERVLVDVDAPEPAVTLAAGAADLAPELKAGASLPDVVERLHAGSSLIRYEAGGDVGAGIRSAPEHLRLDLARAVGSNGKVDAAGEYSVFRNTVPGVVLRMHRALVVQVKDALKQLPHEDESGFQHFYDKPARKLADAAVCGQFVVQDYVREVGQVVGSRAAPAAGSLQEIKGAWRYIRIAVAATASALYGMQITDTGLRTIDNRLGATAASLHLDAKGVQGWLRRVLDSWECATTDFRKGGLVVPSLAECVREHEGHFRFTSLAASIRDDLGVPAPDSSANSRSKSRGDDESGTSQRNPRSRRGRGDRHSPEGGSSDSKGKRSSQQSKAQPKKQHQEDKGKQGQGRPKESSGACAWPDKPRMDAEQFAEFRKEVREKCPDVCNFYLISTCKKDASTCAYPHEVPEAFHAIKKRYSK